MHPVIAILILLFFSTHILALGEWPSLRGPEYDGTAKGGNFAISDGALNVAWKTAIGPGYSGVTIVNGKAITMYSDGNQDIVVAFDATSGKELWKHKFAETYKGHDGSHDGPIATTVVADGRVFGFGARGHLFALDLNTGKLLWSTNAVDFGGQKPFYGFSSSPFVVDGILVVEIGAKEGKAIAALDVANGKPKWMLGDDVVSYQTPIAITFNGKQQIVAVGDKKLFGIDPSGKILWEYGHEGDDRPMASGSVIPVPAGEGKFLLKNKSETSVLLKLVNSADGKITVENVWTAGVFKNTYSQPVYHDGFFYGHNGRILTCVDAANGELKWRSRAPGDGFLIVVDGHLVVQTKAGTLHVAKATPEGWTEKSMLELFPATSWTAPSSADGAVFARSQGEIARIEWKSQVTAAAAPAAIQNVPAPSGFASFLTRVESAPDKKAAVDDFLVSVKSFPLIEWPDQVHFLYRGDAEDMGISGDMTGARREDPMKRVPGTDLFYYSIKLEPDARLNYFYIKNYEQIIADPHNVRLTQDRRGNPNSWFSMPAWDEPSYLNDAPEERRGLLQSHELKSKVRPGGGVNLEVYLPVGYDTNKERYPVLYLFDGPAAKSQGMIVNSFDNLMGTIAQPVVVVLMDDIKTGEKPLEDLKEEVHATIEILTKEVVPFIDSTYRTIADSQSRAAMATGFWSPTILYAAFKNPGLFGAVGSQSAFLLGEEYQLLKDSVRSPQDQPLRMYLDWGSYDIRGTREGWDMVKENRELYSFLRNKGYYPAGGEVHDGTGWTSWRNRTDRWLVTLFPIQ